MYRDPSPLTLIRKCGVYGIYIYIYQSEGLTERINEPPWGRCLQGAVDVRWVVVLLRRRRPESPLAEL